jgi:hypothetical protein
MVPDITQMSGEMADLSDRMSVSPGVITVRPPRTLFGDQYIFGMYVPRPEWRPLNGAETAAMGREGLLQEISLVRLTPPLILALGAASRSSQPRQPASPEDVITRRDIEASLGQEVLDQVLREKVRCTRLIATSLRRVESVSLPRTEERSGAASHGSTTFYPKSDKAIGLHLDTWAHKRDFVESGRPFRCIVNIGEEPRYVVFFNRSPKEISELIGLVSPGLNIEQLLEDNPQEWAQRFLASQGDHPVMRLKILPGEAYVMDTHSCIHDGWAVQRTSPDVFVIVSYIRDAP